MVVSFRERVFDRFFGDIHQQRLQEARAGAGRVREDPAFRRLTESPRDLAPLTHDRQREIAVYLWTYNPLARRIINAIVEWICGEGIQIQASDPRTREYLKRFWTDPVNRWDVRVEERVRELWLMGEQFWPAFTNGYSGIMRLGVLDPSRVKEVVTDPDNALMPIGIITKGATPSEERRYRTVLRGGEQEILGAAALAERERFTDGELFTSAVNKLSTQKRGVSELFALADVLDSYEQLLFNQLQQERVRSMYLWDITIEGADQETIDRKMAELQTPKPFSIWVHNEKESRKLVGPEAGAAQANAESARLFRNHILGGGALPEHWYGGGGDVNRATAAEMSAPTEKSFTSKQRTTKHVIEEVLAVQVERGIAAGVLEDSDEARELEAVFPDLSGEDTSRASQALQQVAGGLVIGRREGWVSDEIAARVLASLISQFGVEADAEEMLSAAQEQRGRSLADEAARWMGREPQPERGRE